MAKVLFEQNLEKPLSGEAVAAVEKTIEAAARVLGVAEPFEVSVTAVEEEEIKAMNQNFRGIDRVTDVLSFPLLEFENGQAKVLPGDFSDGALLIGDIVLCVPRCAAQAKTFGHSFLRELCYLTAHSMAHLWGYDHMEEGEKAAMREKEEEIMKAVGLARGGEEGQ